MRAAHRLYPSATCGSAPFPQFRDERDFCSEISRRTRADCRIILLCIAGKLLVPFALIRYDGPCDERRANFMTTPTVLSFFDNATESYSHVVAIPG